MAGFQVQGDFSSAIQRGAEPRSAAVREQGLSVISAGWKCEQEGLKLKSNTTQPKPSITT